MSAENASRQAYREEAGELLIELEDALLELEAKPDDNDLVDRVFRAMHTIKGSGAMFGFDDIAAFTHEVETVFDRVRDGDLPVSKELLDITFKARDVIGGLLAGGDAEEQAHATAPGLLSRLAALSGGSASADDTAGTSQQADKTGGGADDRQRVYRIRFRPEPDIFTTGTNPVALVEELCELGTGRPVAHMDEVPPLDEMDPQACYVWWDVLLSTTVDEQTVRDVFMFVEDEAEVLIDEMDTDSVDESEHKKLGEILMERGDITAEALQQALNYQKPIGRILVEAGLVTESQVASALAEQQVDRADKVEQQAQQTAAAASIRVAADKLDDLVDLVGELVIVQAQISEVLSSSTDQQLTGLSEELERLTDTLRDSTLGIRMLPIGTTFGRFRRLVRDLAGELGKEIELVTHGADTELDKTVIEQLGDPLVHLIRNSIDHGIEQPDVREAAGKPRRGVITLAAEHSGGDVLITIKDDGKGMDPHKLFEHAVHKGVVDPDEQLSDEACLHLIFAPGFSTAAQVTNVSGRGVGMDVVKRSIDNLRGVVDITSCMGEGTTITIKLPLTLAIIDGLQVEVGGEYYVMPLDEVEECVEMPAEEARSDGKRRMVNLRGDIVPYIRLRDWFAVPGQRPPIEQIVVTTTSAGRMGIVVDHVVGEHQTVIKSLGRIYRSVREISGATIQGDGSMALIVDIAQLVRAAQSMV